MVQPHFLFPSSSITGWREVTKCVSGIPLQQVDWYFTPRLQVAQWKPNPLFWSDRLPITFCPSPLHQTWAEAMNSKFLTVSGMICQPNMSSLKSVAVIRYSLCLLFFGTFALRHFGKILIQCRPTTNFYMCCYWRPDARCPYWSPILVPLYHNHQKSFKFQPALVMKRCPCNDSLS